VKQRALLALLVLHANEVVSRDRIIDELWGERPPATVAAALNVYVSKLRKVLGGAGDGVLHTREPGYVLRVGPGQLDADRFSRLAEEGKQALKEHDPEAAVAKFQEALALWRGPALADLRDEEFALAACARLEEQRQAVLIDRIDAELARGRHAELVGELETLIAENPFHERLWAELMVALYRSGRQADALDAYGRARETLDELGIEPSADLRRLQTQILRQDPALAVASPAHDFAELGSGARRRPRKRKGLLLAAMAIPLVVAAIAIALTRGSDSSAAPLRSNSVAVIDPATNEAVADVPIGGSVYGLSVGGDAVWAANGDDGTIVQIDPETMQAVRTIGVPGIGDVAFGVGAVWALAGDGRRIVRIRPTVPNLRATIPIRQLGRALDAAEQSRRLAFGAGSLWAVDGLSGVARIDPKTNRVVARLDVGGSSPKGIVFSAGALWVLGQKLVQIDARSTRIVWSADFGQRTWDLAAGEGALWVTDKTGNTVWRLNPLLRRADRTIPVGQRPTAVAAGGGSVWAANSYDGTISRIDPKTNRVVATIRVQYQPTHLAFGRGKLWVALR
jgi:YVTN family beta-propeller protein